MSDTLKTTISIKAESLHDLTNALARMADEFGGQIVRDAKVSTTMTLEAEDLDDLRDAIGDVVAAISASEGVEAKVSADSSIWANRRLDPTPMERMINRAVS